MPEDMYCITPGGKKGKKGAVNGKKAEESDIFKLVKMIMQRNFDPVRIATAPNFHVNMQSIMPPKQCKLILLLLQQALWQLSAWQRHF